MSRILALLTLCLLVLAGCKPELVERPTPPKSGSDAPGTATTKGGDPAPTPILPAELMHAGYEYFGLANTEPVRMKINVSGQDEVEGTQTIKLIEVKNGEAIFEITRDGGLSSLPNEQVLLTKDGVYAYKAGDEMVQPRKLELPAVIESGKSWPSDNTFSVQGRTLKQKSTTKIMGNEKVKTKAGEFDALLVTENGTYQVGDDKAEMQGRMWLVKGKGVVKLEFVTKAKDAPDQVVTIEVAK